MLRTQLFFILVFHALSTLSFSESNELTYGRYDPAKYSLHQTSDFFSLRCNTSCMSKDFAKKLKPCLDSIMSELIDSACIVVESQMKKTYYSENPAEFYKSFLNDVSRFILPNDIMQSDNIINLAKKIKTSEYFEEIYIGYSNNKSREEEDIIIKEEDETEGEMLNNEYYSINPYGSFIRCIDKLNNTKPIGDYIDAIQAAGNISINLTADVLVNSLKDRDYEDEIVQSMIIIGIIYPIILPEI